MIEGDNSRRPRRESNLLRSVDERGVTHFRDMGYVDVDDPWTIGEDAGHSVRKEQPKKQQQKKK